QRILSDTSGQPWTPRIRPDKAEVTSSILVSPTGSPPESAPLWVAAVGTARRAQVRLATCRCRLRMGIDSRSSFPGVLSDPTLPDVRAEVHLRAGSVAGLRSMRAGLRHCLEQVACR